MKHFLKKMVIFSVPIWFWIATICIVDPYGLAGSNLIEQKTKQRIAYRLNQRLWKYLEFERRPSEKILLGDSRVDAIKAHMLSSDSSKEFYNFAFGGATIHEINETFWFAAENVSLKEVVIGLSFEGYNGAEAKNRCLESSKVCSNKLLYLINPSVIESTLLIGRDILSGKETEIGKPRKSREEFWSHQIDVRRKQIYSNFEYPTEFHLQLERMTEYCRENGIQLKFVIMPIHMDLQNQIVELGLENDLQRFKDDLSSLGTLYDFHIESDLTTDRDLYSDPVHGRELVVRSVVDVLFNSPNAVDESNAPVSISRLPN